MSVTFLKKDIITCESYKGLCDIVYKVGDQPKGGVIHVNMEEIPSFFQYCKENPHLKFVVVSSCSDFGLAKQREHPVSEDLVKWVRMCVNPDLGYNGISIAPRCELEKCKLEDEYSVKCYAWTAYTFNEIPDNIVRWLSTNVQVYHPKISELPFGTPANSEDDILNQIENNKGKSKEELVYINWTNYTYERAEVENFYKNYGYATVVDHSSKLPYKEYLEQLSKHKLAISPTGNGIDCYRNLECIYLGVVPLTNCPSLSLAYEGLPMLVLRTLRMNKSDLEGIYSYSNEKFNNLNYEKAKLSYWKRVFENERLRCSME